MISINQIKLVDLLPSSIKGDANVLAAAQALDNELQAVTAAINEAIIVPRLEDIPEEVVDLLAWQFHVEFYDPTMTIEQKRAMVIQAIDWHKRKGTPAVVQEIVSKLFVGGIVYEWWEYGGEPYHFRVEVTELISDASVYARLSNLINAVKNTRSWLDSVVLIEGSSLTPYVGIVQFHSSHITIDATDEHIEIGINTGGYMDSGGYMDNGAYMDA